MESKDSKPEQNTAQDVFSATINVCAVWKNVPSQYLSITGLYIGKVKVASYCQNGRNDKSDPKKYSVSSSLPTMKSDLGRFETEEECRAVCIKVARVFCGQLEGK